MGLARVRGEAVPVVDVAHLLGRPSARSSARRFISLEVDGRPVALAVDDVLGLGELPDGAAGALPPLLAPSLAAVEALGALDRSLFLVLSAARLVPAIPPTEPA
jgi:chemotaxis signal transduction protein